MCLPGDNNISGLSRDAGAMHGMADQGSGSIDNRSMGNAGNGVDGTASVVEGSLGSGDGRGVGGNHGAVGVTNQLGGGDRHAGRENLETIFVWSKCKSGMGFFGMVCGSQSIILGIEDKGFFQKINKSEVFIQQKSTRNFMMFVECASVQT